MLASVFPRFRKHMSSFITSDPGNPRELLFTGVQRDIQLACGQSICTTAAPLTVRRRSVVRLYIQVLRVGTVSFDLFSRCPWRFDPIYQLGSASCSLLRACGAQTHHGRLCFAARVATHLPLGFWVLTTACTRSWPCIASTLSTLPRMI